MAEDRKELFAGFHLTSFREGDEVALVEHFADGEVSLRIPALPHPYTPEAARGWVRRREVFVQRHGMEICFAIRDRDGRLLGSVGVDELRIGAEHNGEIGYWLSRDARGCGLAAAAVRTFVPHAFSRLGLTRLTGRTLDWNLPSIRVMQQNGFQAEGCLRRFTRTRTGVYDTLLFGLLRPDAIGA